MNTYYYILLTVFAVLVYMIYVDKNVADYIVILTKLLKINIERFFWIVKYHPNNFITTWIQNQKYDKIAKELEKEFNQKENSL